MAFVKEKRLAALSSALYITSTFDDTTETWASLDTKFPDTIYDSTYSDGWRTEDSFEFNTFKYMGRNTEDDVFIQEDDLHWENLESYLWSPLLRLSGINFDLQDTNWEDTWQNWDLATIMKSSQRLDGNWEDKIQIDIVDEKLPTTSVTNYWKYSWAGINSTWDSLT